MNPDNVFCIRASFSRRETKINFKAISYLPPPYTQNRYFKLKLEIAAGFRVHINIAFSTCLQSVSPNPLTSSSTPGQYQLCIPAVCLSQGAGTCQGGPTGTGGEGAQELLDLCSLTAPTAWRPARAHTAHQTLFHGEQS